MCKKRRDVLISSPKPRSSYRSSATTAAAASTSFPTDSGGRIASTSSSSSTSRSSLATLRDSLPERPVVYPFPEIRSATNNFLSRRVSSSSWRCVLGGRDAVVFQRPFRGGDPSTLPARLSALCRSHHSSLVRLLGVSLAGGHVYLAYEYVSGSSLADCLRNPRNPSFTPLSHWTSRIQIADDLAQGLEYIHTQSATVHNRIKSSAIIVTDPYLRAKICHFGAADLAGEIKIHEEGKELRRPGRIEGSRGYMAPEVLAGGEVTQALDVFAFGVVVLELLSGEEPVKFRMSSDEQGYERASVIETAREVMGEEEVEKRRGRMRRWVDRRLRDSYPVEVAELLIGVALRCVEEDPRRRVDMRWAAGKVSKLLLDSIEWEKTVRVPPEISVSLAPR